MTDTTGHRPWCRMLQGDSPRYCNCGLAAQEPVRARQANTKYDASARRRAQRRGRERGCWLYVPAEELEKAGYRPGDPPPFYRTWGSSRGGVFVRLYREA